MRLDFDKAMLRGLLERKPGMRAAEHSAATRREEDETEIEELYEKVKKHAACTLKG